MKQNWKNISLKEACRINPPKKEVYDILNENQFVSFAPMTDLGVDKKYFIPKSEKELKTVYNQYTFFKEGDVILAKITPCFENGKLGIATRLKNRIGFGSSEFIVYRTKDYLLPDFLYYFLCQSSIRKIGENRMTGAVGHKRIPKDFYEGYKIPIPLLHEQEHIVAKLDQCFEVFDKAKANVECNLQNAKELFQSQLNQIFSQKGDEWVEKKLGDVCQVIAGQSPKGKYYNSDEKGLPFYQGKKEFTDKYIGVPKTWTTMATKEAFEGDILMSVRAPVGPINFSTQHICIGRGLAAIRAGETVNKEYLFYYLLKHENEIVGNTGAVFNSINKTQIGNIVILMVSLSEQEKIVKQIDDMNNQTLFLESHYQQKLDAMDELKKSILQRAFSGEL